MSRILIVDDNEDILAVMKMILIDFGYQVTTLADGNLLFEAVRDSKPDLILLDIMLGDIDGRDLCMQLKRNSTTKEIPVILISASHQVFDHLPLNIGAPDDFLAKPFDIAELLDMVGIHLTAD